MEDHLAWVYQPVPVYNPAQIRVTFNASGAIVPSERTIRVPGGYPVPFRDVIDRSVSTPPPRITPVDPGGIQRTPEEKVRTGKLFVSLVNGHRGKIITATLVSFLEHHDNARLLLAIQDLSSTDNSMTTLCSSVVKFSRRHDAALPLKSHPSVHFSEWARARMDKLALQFVCMRCMHHPHMRASYPSPHSAKQRALLLSLSSTKGTHLSMLMQLPKTDMLLCFHCNLAKQGFITKSAAASLVTKSVSSSPISEAGIMPCPHAIPMTRFYEQPEIECYRQSNIDQRIAKYKRRIAQGDGTQCVAVGILWCDDCSAKSKHKRQSQSAKYKQYMQRKQQRAKAYDAIRKSHGDRSMPY